MSFGFHDKFARVLAPLRPDLVLLCAAAAISLLLWAFLELTDEVFEGNTSDLDARLLLAFRLPTDTSKLLGPPWVADVFRDITALGGTAVLLILTLLIAGYLALAGAKHALCLLAISSIGGLILSNGLKFFFERPRPDLVPHLTPVLTSSFPSGHSTLAATIYLTFAALLVQFIEGRRTRLYVLISTIFIVVMVGISRIALGVHYPSDVAAGWTIGSAWAVGCWTVAYLLKRHGKVEQSLEIESDSDQDHTPQP